MKKSSVLVVGAGATGGLYAARLSLLADVVVIDANREHVEAIRRDGLAVTGRSQLVAQVTACHSGEPLPRHDYDTVLVLVKSRNTREAVEAVLPHLDGDPLFVTFQNGMGNTDVIAQLCRYDIAQGVSFDGGRYAGPGHVEHLTQNEAAVLGPLRGALPKVEAFGRLLVEAGLPTNVVADPRGAVWSKFIVNSIMNPIGALVLGRNRARYEVPEVCALIDRMAEECLAVARAEGIELPFDPMFYVKKLRSGELPLTKHAGSMALDIEAGVPTELDAMTGFIVERAQRHGLGIAATQAVYALTKGLEYAAAIRRQEEESSAH